jgi:hypothetical protein
MSRHGIEKSRKTSEGEKHQPFFLKKKRKREHMRED